MDRILIVGQGFAGRRYTRALRFLAPRSRGRFTVAGVVDSDASRLAAVPDGWAAYDDLEVALAEACPEVVVLAVNEHAHFPVLAALPPCTRAVLCEKPLTTTLEESLRLREVLDTRFVSVNFVERHSPVIGAFHAWWAERPELRPVRVEFFWGKDRIGDPRPTMGVLSEVAHPLDLVDHLVGFERWDVREVHGTVSDFAPSSRAALDGVSLLVETDRCLLLGHASFAWPRRHRNVTVLLDDGAGGLYKVVFDFDMPRWDCDRVEVTRLGALSGPEGVELSVVSHNRDFPRSLKQIFKVSEFVRKSLEGYGTGARFPELVDFAQAVKVQRLLDDISTTLHARGSAHCDMRLAATRTGRAATAAFAG